MNTVAQTLTGRVEGREKDGVLLFAGIPYAAPPVERLRFCAPEPHPTWNDVRSAMKFGPAAPQLATGVLTDPMAPRWSEDCLTLNVSTPALDDSGRPVLVWIHGGAYRTGQGAVPWYNGARFSANGDIVVVSINYRLGALGFTDLSNVSDEFATSGINGTLDQIAALRWVRDNIAQFGGDPARVSIAGESAGGFSVTTLLSSPTAQGLFRGAIPQSGGGHHALSPDAGRLVSETFLRQLAAGSAVELQAAAVDDILQAQQATIAELEAGMGRRDQLQHVSAFYPVFGGESLPKMPIELIRDGNGADVAVLTGSNADETTLWMTGIAGRSPEQFAESYGKPELAEIYRRTRPEATDTQLAVALSTDQTFRIPGIRLAEAHAGNGGRTWLYQFNWRSRAFEGHLGATHSLEIPFTFDNLDRSGVDVFLGPGPLPQHVADTMHAEWTRFIRDQQTSWPPYDSERRATMMFDDESAVVDDPNANERIAWQGVR